MRDKIHSLDELARVAAAHRAEGKTVGLCHGTFDLLHVGHIRHLSEAAQQADHLFVTITADAFVHKGPGRPVFSHDLRAEHVAALGCVDGVAINHQVTSINVLEAVRPDVYIKGGEYRDENADVTGNISREREVVEACGGAVYYTDGITYSSTKLLNDHFDVFTDEQRQYLTDLRTRYDDVNIIDHVRALEDLRVLVVGDTIVDEYHYTTPMGQTGKYNVLAVKYDSEERFAGGAVAVANHIAGFAKQVTLLSALGQHESHEAFIRSRLKSEVTPQFFWFQSHPTVVKRRFVDADMAKLFEVYFFGDGDIDQTVDQYSADWLEAHLNEYDLVVVPDFGNGFIGPKMIDALQKHARFLAVNTQLNSGNRGYHVATRYARADLISLNEPELRMAVHNRHDALDGLAMTLGRQLGASAVAVTRGVNGVMFVDCRNECVYSVPALSTRVVDRIGAGDAFLSLAALTYAGLQTSELAAFIGSVAAALDVQIVCNRNSVEAAPFFKYIKTLLK